MSGLATRVEIESRHAVLQDPSERLAGRWMLASEDPIERLDMDPAAQRDSNRLPGIYQR